jgi:beta propeller domain-containing protein
MGKRTTLAALLAILASTAAVETLDGAASPATPTVAGQAVRLKRFPGCGDFLDYVKQNAAPSVTAWGFLGRMGEEAVGPVPEPPRLPIPGGPIPAPTPPVAQPSLPTQSGRASETPEPDFSTTNTQELGVDEPDIIKSNGATLFALAKGKLHAVDITGERPRRLDSLALESAGDQQLLLRGDTLLVISNEGADRLEGLGERRVIRSSVVPSTTPTPPKTVLTQIDVSKPGWMRVVRRLSFEGRYLNTRLVKGSARIVFTSSVPGDLRFFRPRHFAFPEEALARNRAVIASSRTADWLPGYEIRNVRTKAKTRRSVQCRHVSRPPRFSGFGMLTVLTIDLDNGLEPVESDAILADGDIVYASETSLYVATQRWAGREPAGDSRTPPKLATSLHKFDISHPSRTAYRSTGTVPGYLLNQWALSEHDGVLRGATTELPMSAQVGSESTVTTLREEAGKLVQLGRVGGLGHGERIFGVRFIGDVGYVVTFRQTDPLYTLDLSNPARPRLLGELKIPGYSAYLHPAGENLLLGLGQDATEDGAILGTQLSVFDVSDLRKPVRVHRRAIEGAASEAEIDHHAFLYWSKTRLVVVPIETLSPGRSFQGVVGFRIGRDRLEEVGRITHGRGKVFSDRAWSSAEPIRRTSVVRDLLLTVSEAGVRASDLKTFADRGWADFG